MSDVTFIGLGMMGRALANKTQEAGYSITVWNRSADKADALVAQGATFKPDIVDAISVSPLVIVCVGSYEVANLILKNDACMMALKDKTLVQLTSGTARDAKEMNEWVSAAGARYVDGGIESYPDGIGEPDSMFMVAGDQQGFQEAEPLLKTLAPILHYLGDDPARAGAMYSAMISGSMGFIFGVMHAVAICEAAGITMKQYLDVVGPVFKTDTNLVKEMAEKCESGDLKETEAYLSVWNETLGSVVDTLNDHNLNSDVPALMHDFLNRAEKAGYARHDLAAMIELIRNRN